MALIDDIKKIWTEAFDDTPEYVDMYFDRVYRDADVVATMHSGHAVSSMLLQRYAILFHGSEMGMSYIAGAATRRQMRGKGLMQGLIAEALRVSRERGDMLCALIPASDWLYFFYEKSGFATVFYVDPQRYTSLHQFAATGATSYHEIENVFDERVWLGFDSLQRKRPGMVIHSHRDFLNILDDLRMDGGRFVVIADAEGQVVSMAWAVADESSAEGVVTVKEVLATDAESAKASLRALREHFPDRAFKVLASAQGDGRKLYQRGMGRLVNAGAALDAIVRAYPHTRQAIRVYDPILPDNNHIYLMREGTVTVDDSYGGALDLDVDITTLTQLVFSSERIGEVTGLPAERPHISLMLD